ncbi:MAG TPA: hypothetical protein VK506_01850 [Conexibacter sp.]|nr:hypothetical protein [Conexibacter sp.]
MSEDGVTDTAPYERLAELAERELALVTAFEPSRIGELVALQQTRTTLVTSLPEQPPASARGALLRAHEAQQRTTAALTVLCDQLGHELGDVDRGRQAARSYAAVPPPRPVLDATG